MSRVKPSVLFVCLGNICRSPTAEGVFRRLAQQNGLDLTVDSAGTAGFHKAAAPDKRSQQVALDKGYDLSALKCRRVTEQDFEDFDYIIAMDESNVRELKRKCPDELQHKITLLMSYCESDFAEVPDPYYGGAKGFELVFDLIEKASKGLLMTITQSQKSA